MKQNKPLYKTLKIIYSSLVKILYRPKVYGKQNIPEKGGVIFVGNHRHAFDPVVVMTYTKRIVHYMAKESIFKGIHGKILKEIGLIKVYRTKSNPVAVTEAVEILKQGGTVGIFPEGHRNKTGEDLLKFRHGAVAIAKQANTKIVPFAIRGQYKIFKKGLELEFGEPVDISKMEIEEANNFIRDEVLRLYRKQEKNEVYIYNK